MARALSCEASFDIFPSCWHKWRLHLSIWDHFSAWAGGRFWGRRKQTPSPQNMPPPTEERSVLEIEVPRRRQFTSVVHRHRALAVAPQTHPPEAWQHLVPSLKVLAKRPVCASFRPTRPLALPRGGQDTCAQPASAPFASNGDKPIQWSAMSCIYICSHLCDKTTSFPA